MINPNYNEKARRWKLRFPGFIFFTAIAALLLGSIVMWLWNAILPVLLQAKNISYWQAVGLLVLCKILFGNFRSGSVFPRKRFGQPPYWKEKLMNMTEEEKAAMKEEWKKRCERRRQ